MVRAEREKERGKGIETETSITGTQKNGQTK